MTDKETELRYYWRASSRARAIIAGRRRDDSAPNDPLEGVEDLAALEIMTDWEKLRTACSCNLASIPTPRKRQLGIAG